MTPEDLSAGARAMYERQSKQVGGLPTWDKLTQKTRDGITADFEHGVAALPDHTGELLSALDRLHRMAKLLLARQPVRDVAETLAEAEAAIAKARARMGEGK